MGRVKWQTDEADIAFHCRLRRPEREMASVAVKNNNHWAISMDFLLSLHEYIDAYMMH